MFYPCLIYGYIVWVNSYSSNLHKFYLLQKQSVRVTTVKLCKGLCSPFQKTKDVFSIRHKYSPDICVYIQIFVLCLYLYHHFAASSHLMLMFSHIILVRLIIFTSLLIKHTQYSLRYFYVQTWNVKVHVIKSLPTLEIFKSKFHHIHDV